MEVAKAADVEVAVAAVDGLDGQLAGMVIMKVSC